MTPFRDLAHPAARHEPAGDDEIGAGLRALTHRLPRRAVVVVVGWRDEHVGRRGLGEAGADRTERPRRRRSRFLMVRISGCQSSTE